jgi:hypothetical protein
LPGQDVEARRARRHEAGVPGEAAQVLADDVRIEEGVSLVGDQRGDLAERIGAQIAGVGRDRADALRDELDAIAQPELGGDDATLAGEGGEVRGVELHAVH